MKTDPDPVLAIPPADDEIARLSATLNALLARLHAALARERQFTPTPATNCAPR